MQPMNGTDTGALPPAFVSRLHRLLGGDGAGRVLAALAAPRRTAFRVNPLCCTDPGAALAELAAAGVEPVPVEWLPGAFHVAPDQRGALTRSGPVTRGELYVQNPASMLPPLVLAPGPGDEVLDLAAAPGSKTLQLAAMVAAPSQVAAVEAVRGRFFRLRANLARHGAGAVRTYLKDGGRVWRQVGERFDAVLLDAPCSAEGQFHLSVPASFAYWSGRKVREMAHKQRRLLASAVHCARPGGVIVYATCTLAPEENEAVVDAVLRRFPGALEVEPVPLGVPGGLPGRTAWEDAAYDPRLVQALRILPDGLMEGFFICRLRKTASTAGDSRGRRSSENR